jgi:flagellar hook-basal body complex protein FliE
VANFTLAEQALAFRFWNLKSQQAATQTPGQPAGQLQATQMPPAVNNILMSMLYDPEMTTPQAIWSKISTYEQIPEGLKRAAFDEFLKLRSNQIYGAQQAQAQPPVASAQFTLDQETQISNVVNAAMKAHSGQKFNYIKKLRIDDKITQPIYDEAIKRLKEKVTLLQSMRQK